MPPTATSPPPRSSLCSSCPASSPGSTAGPSYRPIRSPLARRVHHGSHACWHPAAWRELVGARGFPRQGLLPKRSGPGYALHPPSAHRYFPRSSAARSQPITPNARNPQARRASQRSGVSASLCESDAAPCRSRHPAARRETCLGARYGARQGLGAACLPLPGRTMRDPGQYRGESVCPGQNAATTAVF